MPAISEMTTTELNAALKELDAKLDREEDADIANRLLHERRNVWLALKQRKAAQSC